MTSDGYPNPYCPVRSPDLLKNLRIGCLRISKNDRIASWQFKKKFDAVAEDCKKRADRLLRIPEKHRPRPARLFAPPTNNHHILRRSPARLCARSRKKPGQGGVRFKKKSGSRAEDSGKSSDRLLRIPEKERIAC
jgi:hypothetical protein